MTAGVRFFILTVAAAESAIGLAILVVLFRNRSTIDERRLTPSRLSRKNNNMSQLSQTCWSQCP
jgi:hypothetical protein